MPVDQTCMNKAYLLIGGNIGDREHYLLAAREVIEKKCGCIVSTSALYETEAWGVKDQSSFLNQALEIETDHSAIELLFCLLKIEEGLGRKREVKYGPRTIDIDILLFNSEKISEKDLIIPHPQMHLRRFALECLNEIAPDVIHPVFIKPVRQLLAECTDPLAVNKIN